MKIAKNVQETRNENPTTVNPKASNVAWVAKVNLESVPIMAMQTLGSGIEEIRNDDTTPKVVENPNQGTPVSILRRISAQPQVLISGSSIEQPFSQLEKETVELQSEQATEAVELQTNTVVETTRTQGMEAEDELVNAMGVREQTGLEGEATPSNPNRFAVLEVCEDDEVMANNSLQLRQTMEGIDGENKEDSSLHL